MEKLAADLCLKIFSLLDHQNLATVEQVCRKWKVMASDNIIWSKLFEERWGSDHASFYAPVDSKSWKDAYEVQDRCDRVGLGLKIIREGGDYYLVHQGEIQRHLGSRRRQEGANDCSLGSERHLIEEEEEDDEGTSVDEEKEPRVGLLDKMLFFIGDLEVASSICAKRCRVL